MTNWREQARERITSKLFPKPAFLPEPYPSLDSYQSRLQRHDAWFVWTLPRDFEYMTTVQFGEPRSEAQIAMAIRRLCALMDRYWLGRHWSRYPAGERTDYIGAVEEGPKRGHSHVHLLLRRPRSVVQRSVEGSWREQAQARCLSCVFTDLARRKGVCPHGDVRFNRLNNEHDRMQAASYVLKDFHVGRDLILPGV